MGNKIGRGNGSGSRWVLYGVHIGKYSDFCAQSPQLGPHVVYGGELNEK